MHEKRLNTLITNEMQIRSTMRYHLTPARIALIKKNTNNKCWWGCGKMGTLVHWWWECKLVQSLRKTVWRFLQILRIALPYYPAILQYVLAKSKNTNLKRYLTALFRIANIWKQSKCPPTDEWIKRMWYTCIIEYIQS